MNWRVSAFVLLGTVVAACAEPPAAPTATIGAVSSMSNLSATDRHIVLFKGSLVPSDFSARVSAAGGTVESVHAGAGVAVVSGLSESAAASLSDLGEIGASEMFQFLDEPRVDVQAVGDALPQPSSPSNPTTAAAYARQWNLRQIGAPAAWTAGKLGSPSVKVAILDTGIDYLYPDLAGLVDLDNSINLTNDAPLVAAFFPGRHPSTDLHYHGTHVAATVASNALIAAGVTSRTTLMAVKVLNVNGSGATDWILNGIIYAADHGADVINMSLGVANPPFSTKLKANKDFFNKVMDRVFTYARTRGVTIVVAAGNESQNLDIKHTVKMYCGAMHTVCVSATGPTAGSTNGPWTDIDAFASYSNYGLNQIDIAAPGGNTGGAVWAGCSTSSLQIPVCQTGIYILGLAGTSMATPHVSGLAALLIAERAGGVALGEIRSTIFNSALDLGAAGEDAFFGHGRINVAKALRLE